MPPSTRPPHDPFTATSSTSAGLSAGPTLRHQVSQQSLRSNASSASARQQQRERLARPRRAEGDVLADTESEQEASVTRRQRPQMRKLRHGSPARTKLKQQAEEQEIVNRGPDGRYFLKGTVPEMPLMAEAFEQSTHQYDHARKYFTSGAHQSTRTSRQTEDDFERELPELVMNLRDEVMLKLENERWKYEPSNRFRPV